MLPIQACFVLAWGCLNAADAIISLSRLGGIFGSSETSVTKGVNQHMHASIETVICSRAKRFTGTYLSTFTGYIHHLRGYHGLGDESYLHAQREGRRILGILDQVAVDGCGSGELAGQATMESSYIGRGMHRRRRGQPFNAFNCYLNENESLFLISIHEVIVTVAPQPFYSLPKSTVVQQYSTIEEESQSLRVSLPT